MNADSITSAYRRGFNDGLANARMEKSRMRKIWHTGFAFRMHDVFIGETERVCECETKQHAEELRELVFTQVTIVKPSCDLTYFDYCNRDFEKGVET